MFWRFGFHNASAIDSLLDKDDVSLEAILDEDDLLQECKSQNTRLMDYFQREDVLQRLFAYVTGQIGGEEDKGRFKYPYVATEVLCSEIWSIVETCVRSSDHLLTPFWETVLDRTPDEMKGELTMASHFAKINSVFLSKKPAEMLEFIQSQPDVVSRLLLHVESPAIVDLIVRIIQLDEQPAGAGVLEWLSSQDLTGKLIVLLSPAHTSDMHVVVSELVKGIVSMAAPSPAAGLTDGLQNGPASNRFARELASRMSVARLVDYILCDFPPPRSESASEDDMDEDEDDAENVLPDRQSCASAVTHGISIIIELIRKNNSDYFEPYLFHTLRNRLIQVQQHLQGVENARETLEAAMREMVDRMGVVHLGPVLEIMCERLDTFQGYLRQPRSMGDPVPTTVGPLIPLTLERYRICELYAELLHCSNMSLLNRASEYDHLYDADGRLQGGLAALEQLARVIAIGSGDDPDREGAGGGAGGAGDDMGEDEIEPALALPVTSPSREASLLDSDDEDDEDMAAMSAGGSDDEAMEEIAMFDKDEEDGHAKERKGEASGGFPVTKMDPAEASTIITSPEPTADTSGGSGIQTSPMAMPSSPNATKSPSPLELATQGVTILSPESPIARPLSAHSKRSARRSIIGPSIPAEKPVGERLKQRFLDTGVLVTLLDLFFDFPWNNFLHSAVYDFIHQILTGKVDTGTNRELNISLFRDARLMHRIVEGQKQNDIASSQPKGVRLGYMGHLTLISEDVITALEHYPPDLRLLVAQYAPQPEWDEYVTGRYNEAKKRDTSLLGGGKPVAGAAGGPGGTAGGAAGKAGTRWKIDEEDPDVAAVAKGGGSPRGAITGELKRGGGGSGAPKNTADFGPPPPEEEHEDDGSTPPQFARYLAQEMNASESSDEEDDEDGGWLAHSRFDLGKPPPRRQHARQPTSAATGFDDAFEVTAALGQAAPTPTVTGPTGAAFSSTGSLREALSDDPFGVNVPTDDDDAFGPFADPARTTPNSSSDPFSIFSSTSGSFGEDDFDFGDFQAADSSGESSGELGEFASPRTKHNDHDDDGDGDGDLTPTGSWTFASELSAEDDEFGSRGLETISLDDHPSSDAQSQSRSSSQSVSPGSQQHSGHSRNSGMFESGW